MYIQVLCYFWVGQWEAQEEKSFEQKRRCLLNTKIPSGNDNASQGQSAVINCFVSPSRIRTYKSVYEHTNITSQCISAWSTVETILWHTWTDWISHLWNCRITWSSSAKLYKRWKSLWMILANQNSRFNPRAGWLAKTDHLLWIFFKSTHCWLPVQPVMASHWTYHLPRQPTGNWFDCYVLDRMRN